MRYKVWHKGQERWVQDDLYVYIDPDGDVLVIDEGDFGIMYRSRITDDVEICRFTGLTDRNGKEIYEGDIISFKDNWDDADTDLPERVGMVGYADASFRIERGSTNHYRWMDYTVEVIGNRFETPELLKGE